MNKAEKVTQDIFLFKGINPIKADVEISANFRGVNFEVITSPEEFEVHYPTSAGGEMITKCNILRISFLQPASEDVFFTINKILEITDILSLLTADFYFGTSLTHLYVRPGGISYNQPYESPTQLNGITTKAIKSDNIQVSNDQVIDFFNKINKLSEEDYSYFRSSAHLMRYAKHRLGRGENSGSITDAISASEALYSREGYRNYDMRFIEDTPSKTEAFRRIFTENETENELSEIITNLKPYKIRSDHLHRGIIEIHKKELPRRQKNSYDTCIDHCQEIIISSLDKFLS